MIRKLNQKTDFDLSLSRNIKETIESPQYNEKHNLQNY